MKKYYLFLSIILLATTITSAQIITDSCSSIKNNSIFIELGGNSGNLVFIGLLDLDISSMYSFNYERLLHINNRNNIGVNIGFGYYPQRWKNYSYPLEISYIYGSNNHFFESGIGLTYLKTISKNNFSRQYPVFMYRVGYRFQSPDGFLFRAGFTPVYDYERYFFDNSFLLFPFLGFSFGYSF